jgi:hypothetical protein
MTWPWLQNARRGASLAGEVSSDGSVLEDPGRDWGVSEVFIGSGDDDGGRSHADKGHLSPMDAGRQRPDRAIYERAGVDQAKPSCGCPPRPGDTPLDVKHFFMSSSHRPRA